MMRFQRAILDGPASSRPAIERRQRMGEKVATPNSVPFSRIHSKRADLSNPWQRIMRTGDSLLPGRRSSRWTSTPVLLIVVTDATTSSPLLSSRSSCSPIVRRKTSRTWWASSFGREILVFVSFSNSGGMKNRCILLRHNQRDPIIDHRCFNQLQAGIKERLLRLVGAFLDDGGGNKKPTWGQYLCEMGRDGADDTRNDIRQHYVILALHAFRLSLVKCAQYYGNAVVQVIGSRICYGTFNRH